MVQRARQALLSAAVGLVCAWGLAGCGSGSGSSTPQPEAKRVLDTSYGVGGQVALPSGGCCIVPAPDGAVFVALSSNGIFKFDATGRTVSLILAVPPDAFVVDKLGNGYAAFLNAVYKFTAAGPDPGYGTSGMALVFTPEQHVKTRVASLIPLPDGSLYVILGQSLQPYFPDTALIIVKLGPDGAPVASFGNGGRVTHQPPSMSAPVGAVIDSAGGLYVSFWNAEGVGARMNLAKFDRNGNLDTAFGSAGIWSGSGSSNRCVAMHPAIDSSGFLWLPGECIDASGAFSEVLVKLDPTGVPVPGFGKNGYLDGFYGPVPDKRAESMAQRIVIAPDGTLYVSGYTFVLPGCARYRLVALDPQGNRITSFGTDGAIIGAREAALDGANRLYVLSRAFSCPSSDQAPDVLSRYL